MSRYWCLTLTLPIGSKYTLNIITDPNKLVSTEHLYSPKNEALSLWDGSTIIVQSEVTSYTLMI